MSAKSPTCPTCGDRSPLQRIGPIAASDVFAGRRLQRPLPGGDLYRCRGCELRFRHPRPDKDELDRLYREGEPLRWAGRTEHRNDWRALASWIKQHASPAARILDVGCSEGGFLASLPPELRRFGIEVQPEAAQIARQRGIEMLGSDFSVLEGLDLRFDVVTAVDVIEHVEEPRAFLRLLGACVTPGGIVAVSSGNADAPSWRLMGGRYWYCTIPEHLSFIGPAWCAKASGLVGLTLEQTARYCHGSYSLGRRFAECGKNVLYRFAPGAMACMRTLGLGRKDTRGFPELERHPPRWDSARDHFAALFRKG